MMALEYIEQVCQNQLVLDYLLLSTASSSTKEYFYGVIYEFTDAMGNVISSRMKTASVIDSAAVSGNNSISVTILF